MLGERSDQRGLWEADRLYLDHVGTGHLLRSAGITAGPAVPGTRISPSSTARTTAGTVCRPACWRRRLLLQSHDKVSDAEAKARADFDLRWKVALGIEVEDRPFAKSTLQVFPRPADPARPGAGGIRVQPEAGPGSRGT